MQTIEQVTGPGMPLLLDDIDTDRIIPARYLRCVTFEGLGEHAFEDDRKQDTNHPFDKPQYANANVLVAGRNFGCGSSREHAPQSLMRWGINAIVAESFAEIFFGNCTALGIPAVTTSRANLEKLTAAIKADPTLEITVDLMKKEVRCGSETVPCDMPPQRDSLTSGQWDFLGLLLDAKPEIQQKAARVPYFSNFA